MKNTFLVKKQNEKGETVLTEVSASEWFALIEENRSLPKQQQRYFIADCIEDSHEIDRIFIEVSREEHHKWNSSHTISERNRKLGNSFLHLSLDDFLAGSEELRVADVLADTSCTEGAVLSQMRMTELQNALRLWKPWAMDFYYAYLAGKKRKCTGKIAEKYGVSLQTARSYKRQFENFVKNFLI
ncbi:MAG: hypothetical protein J1E35_07110 [Lachnospiraceae bacterium]|nr:hypothetical protein [Lachnospiraceae bacterium]